METGLKPGDKASEHLVVWMATNGNIQSTRALIIFVYTQLVRRFIVSLIISDEAAQPQESLSLQSLANKRPSMERHMTHDCFNDPTSCYNSQCCAVLIRRNVAISSTTFRTSIPLLKANAGIITSLDSVSLQHDCVCDIFPSSPAVSL